MVEGRGRKRAPDTWHARAAAAAAATVRHPVSPENPPAARAQCSRPSAPLVVREPRHQARLAGESARSRLRRSKVPPRWLVRSAHDSPSQALFAAAGRACRGGPETTVADASHAGAARSPPSPAAFAPRARPPCAGRLWPRRPVRRQHLGPVLQAGRAGACAPRRITAQTRPPPRGAVRNTVTSRRHPHALRRAAKN